MTVCRIGLTGGIGSGKSTVTQMFAELGVPVLDLDRVGRAVTAPGSPGLARIVKTFGPAMLNADGTLNRKALAQHCFSDPEQTRKLNAITHPLIRDAEQQWLRQQQSCYAVIEASVLLESGGQDRMDAVIVVMADLEIRRQRVLERGDRTAGQFEAIVARQCSDGERRAAADYLIINNGSEDELRQQVCRIHECLHNR